jgi:hypothetical protein
VTTPTKVPVAVCARIPALSSKIAPLSQMRREMDMVLPPGRISMESLRNSFGNLAVKRADYTGK